MEYLELIKIKGIPLRVHPSWAFILLLFTWSSQTQLSNLLTIQIPLLLCWCIGFLSSLLVFLSVLLHELGHSLVALHEGLRIRSITLFFLGGVAITEKECDTPMASLRVAIAGPLVSFFLAIFFLGCSQFLFSQGSIASIVFTQLGSINLLLTFFNLLPGLPLDGGLILKSIVWYLTGNKRKGLKVANASGRWLSLCALFLGSVICFTGGGLVGVWLIVIGWFGFSFSRSQNQIFTFEDILCALKVTEASSRGFIVLEADKKLRSLSELYSDETRQNLSPKWILICSSGRWIGYVTEKILKEVPVQFWNDYCLSEYCSPLSDLPSISDRAPLWEAILNLESTAQDRLLVFNLAGLPSGTIDRVDIGKAVLLKIGIKLPKAFFEAARKKNTYPLGMSLVKLVEGMISSGLISESGETK